MTLWDIISTFFVVVLGMIAAYFIVMLLGGALLEFLAWIMRRK